MVKTTPHAGSAGPGPSSGRPKWLLLIALTGVMLYFGLPPFLEQDREGNYVLSDERLRDAYKKMERSEKVEVYQLVATVPGLYPCYACPGIETVWLNPGAVWKYGISRKGEGRYTKAFYKLLKVQYIPIVETDILAAEQLEIELIVSYPLLPESQSRMKKQGIFLKRPPGNAKDR